MQFLAAKNISQRDVFNMMQFKLTNIEYNANGDVMFTLDDKVFEHSIFAAAFIPAFCLTVLQISGSYNQSTI